LKIYEDKLVVVSFSTLECKYLLEAYIQYLAALASGLQVQLVFISANRNEAYCGSPLSAFEAKSRLEALVKLYKDGHENMLAFYPQFDVDPHTVDEMKVEAFFKVLNGVVDNYTFPCTDTYIMNEWSKGSYNEPGILEWYKHNCTLLLKPLTEIFPTYYPVQTKKSKKNETTVTI
jgi:exodeoxyribonuclease V gamma subunit